MPHVWAKDRLNRAEHLVQQELIRLSEEVRRRAAACPDKTTRKQMYGFAANLLSRGAVTRTVAGLQAHPLLTVTVEAFDHDDFLLNTPTGVVDLRTGKLHEPDPHKLMSKTTAVGPADMEPTRWLQFLEETTGGDTALQQYLQKLVGYSLTGSTQEQVLTFIYGPPLTGKSVFLDVIGGLFGTYHEVAPADTFAHTNSDRHPADLAMLAGARLVTASETREGRSWDTERVKRVTGGDSVSARFMRQDFFTYVPRYQIVIVGNHAPEIKGVDDAIMRRIHIVPFEHSPAQIDRLLTEKLKEEWPGILTWAIAGCQLWLAEGLEPPDIVKARTAEYKREEDPISAFIEDCCEIGPDDDAAYRVTRQDLYEAWRQWCHQQGEEPGSLKQLKRRLDAKRKLYGYADRRVRDGDGQKQGYHGIRLLDQEGLL
jgi:putative DNA primase/helicase